MVTAQGPVDAEIIDSTNEDNEIVLQGAGGITPAVRAEVDMQITTARRYPRSVDKFKKEALSLATLDEETAESCLYALPRGGKPIEGPSVRLAEIVLGAWGNVRADAKVIDVQDKHITAEGMCWDLEKNVAVRVQVKRRITDRHGKRYNDDMIVVTGNAACAIALRNAIFKVIPMAVTKTIYNAARQTAIGDVKTLASKRASMIEHFGKMGITPDRVFSAVGKRGLDDIGLDELARLKGMATALKEGDSNVDEMFPPIEAPPDGKSSFGFKGGQKAAGGDGDVGSAKQATPATAATGGDEGGQNEGKKALPEDALGKDGKKSFESLMLLAMKGLATDEDVESVSRDQARKALVEVLGGAGIEISDLDDGKKRVEALSALNKRGWK